MFKKFKLIRYAKGQHDLICEAVGCGKSYLDPGCTAYEAVCVLMAKVDEARLYLEYQPGEDASTLLNYLNAHHDAEELDMIQLYDGGKP